MWKCLETIFTSAEQMTLLHEKSWLWHRTNWSWTFFSDLNLVHIKTTMNLRVQFNGLSYPIVNIEEVGLSCFFVQYSSPSGRAWSIVSLLENFAKRKIFASILTQLKKRRDASRIFYTLTFGHRSGESRKKKHPILSSWIFIYFHPLVYSHISHCLIQRLHIRLANF